MSDDRPDKTATEVLIRQTIAPIDHGLKKLRESHEGQREVVLKLTQRLNTTEAYIEQQEPAEPTLDLLYKALATAQGEIQAADAKSEADMGTYQYRYADLAACLDVIRKPLAENGLCLIQIPSINGTEVKIETVLGHESGQSISCSMSMQSEKGSPQAIGAVMTYLRRYSLCSLIGVAQFDDDAASATKGPEEYDRLTPRDIDEILQKADELFAEKADFVLEQMTTLVFNVKHLADIPADQLKTALKRLKNTADREAKKAKDAEKAPVVEPKPKAKPKAKPDEKNREPTQEEIDKFQPVNREPGSDDDKA